MKARGQIVRIEPTNTAEVSAPLRVEIESLTKQFAGGRDHQVAIRAVITAERSALKDLAIGDFFDITIEVHKP